MALCASAVSPRVSLNTSPRALAMYAALREGLRELPEAFWPICVDGGGPTTARNSRPQAAGGDWAPSSPAGPLRPWLSTSPRALAVRAAPLSGLRGLLRSSHGASHAAGAGDALFLRVSLNISPRALAVYAAPLRGLRELLLFSPGASQADDAEGQGELQGLGQGEGDGVSVAAQRSARSVNNSGRWLLPVNTDLGILDPELLPGLTGPRSSVACGLAFPHTETASSSKDDAGWPKNWPVMARPVVSLALGKGGRRNWSPTGRRPSSPSSRMGFFPPALTDFRVLALLLHREAGTNHSQVSSRAPATCWLARGKGSARGALLRLHRSGRQGLATRFSHK